MFVTMKRHEFESMDDYPLSWACIEPVIQQVKGKDNTVRTQVYSQLSMGQQALMMFMVLYNHAHSVEEFYWYSCYFRSQPKVWSAIESSMDFFADDAMLEVYEKLEGTVQNRLYLQDHTEQEISINDLETDSDLHAAFSQIHSEYRHFAVNTLRRIGTYIRSNPIEFAVLED